MGKVCVCIFHKEDVRSVEQRLEVAVNRYQQECRQESVLSGRDDMGLIHVRMDAACPKGVAKADAELVDHNKNNVGQMDVECVAGILQVQRTEKGKPYFSNCPQIQFSISHSGDYWVCAVAGEAVGIDLQQHTLAKNETEEAAAVRLQKMARRFFHPAEVKFVEIDSYRNFFAVWAAREAYVKYTGAGIDRHFSEYCVVTEREYCSKVCEGSEEDPQSELRGNLDVKLRSELCRESVEEHLAGMGSEPGGEHSAGMFRVTDDICWQAMDVFFRETVYRGKYTLCVCTQGESKCRIIEC